MCGGEHKISKGETNESTDKSEGRSAMLFGRTIAKLKKIAGIRTHREGDWGLVTVGCGKCKVSVVMPKCRVSLRCAHCHSYDLLEYPTPNTSFPLTAGPAIGYGKHAKRT